MRKVLVKDIEKELTHLIQNKIEDNIYCIHERPLVFKSRNGEINEQYCIDNNIPICNSFNMGGTIVADVNDINMAIMKQEGWKVGRTLLNTIKEKLKGKIENLSIDKNDLIADGKYKLMSYASINANNRLIYTCVHISMNPNMNLIENICTKKMNKIPKGFTDYGITTDYIMSLIIELIGE